ncbi:MAG: phosphatidylserine decarboxylase, partial [Gemmatimonadales bacterium]
GDGVWAAAALAVALALWLLVFFRDPAREGPRGVHLVIAPADGKVVSLVEADEPTYLRAAARRVSIFMNVFDVHVNRYPVAGTIEFVRYHPGRFLHAGGDKASLDNEQASVGIRTAHGPVLVRQIAGLVARRIVTDGRPGDRAVQGERMGMIRFGSRLDVFVPLAARPVARVAPGDRVQAGVTVLLELPE